MLSGRTGCVKEARPVRDRWVARTGVKTARCINLHVSCRAPWVPLDAQEVLLSRIVTVLCGLFIVACDAPVDMDGSDPLFEEQLRVAEVDATTVSRTSGSESVCALETSVAGPKGSSMELGSW